MTCKPPLIDQAARDDFVQAIDRGFSVIAPAGVGKTTAIVSRIAHIALTDQQKDEPLLPKLVLVTYTNKAANEMQERARLRLLEHRVSAARVAHFNQAFFGTIHSFCLELLRQYGYIIGLPSRFSLVTDEDGLWLEFLRSADVVQHGLPEHAREAFARYGALYKALQLARRMPCGAPPQLTPCPRVELEPLLQFAADTARNAAAIEQGKQLVRNWQAAIARGDYALGIPEFSKGGKAFQQVWQAAWQPLRVWLGTATLVLARGVAQDFQAYRVARGQLTYADMVSLARTLVRHPEAGPMIRRLGYRVILDEAQDTDQDQFDVLLGVTGNSLAELKEAAFVHPEPGRFCMVGDPQQSIFSSRADLSVYLKVHADLCAAGVAQQLTFHVTMRCDTAVVNVVNALFPHVLQARTGPTRQVDYVPLQARPDAGVGQVQKIELLPQEDLATGQGSKAVDTALARAFAAWLAARSVADFGIQDWSAAVVLCPRNEWLSLLAKALQDHGVPVQVHSRKDILGDNPAYAWLTALVHVLVYPEDAFEIVGVLREVFGLSDDALATYVDAHDLKSGAAHPLSLHVAIAGAGPVAEALKQLQHVRLAIVGKPLRAAVHLVVEQLALGARLHALPTWEHTLLDDVLQQLMIDATLAEEQGLTLQDWAARLEQTFYDSAEAYTPLAGHVQLFSCHKAKGLEWPVVFMPFFFKPIRSRNEMYPRYIEPGEGYAPLVLYDKHMSHVEPVRWARENTFYEHQRLCYVTLTRAARQCYIVDDQAFYTNATGSFADGMHCLERQKNRVQWERIERFTTTSVPPTSSREACTVQPPRLREDAWLGKPLSVALADSVAHAQQFVRRVLPSSLALHAQAYAHHRDERDAATEPRFPEVTAEAAARAGADYGNWWHAMMEHLPWSSEEAAWHAYFAQQLSDCPSAARGNIEIEQFMASEAAQVLQQSAAGVKTELPFLWRQGDTAYDGYIDLVAYQEHHDSWIVVDWKTDIVKQDAQELIAIYGPQLAAYVDALRAIFAKPVTGYLYSTRLGRWAQLLSPSVKNAHPHPT